MCTRIGEHTWPATLSEPEGHLSVSELFKCICAALRFQTSTPASGGPSATAGLFVGVNFALRNELLFRQYRPAQKCQYESSQLAHVFTVLCIMILHSWHFLVSNLSNDTCRPIIDTPYHWCNPNPISSTLVSRQAWKSRRRNLGNAAMAELVPETRQELNRVLR